MLNYLEIENLTDSYKFVADMNNSLGPNFWYFIVIIFLIAGTAMSIILYLRSSTPDDWYHESFVDNDFYMAGRLGDLASTIRMMPADYSDNSQVKQNIEMMFFDKIRKKYGFSYSEIIEMKNSDPEKLRVMINDDYIFNWIINFQEMKNQYPGNYDGRISKKEMFINDLNQVLDKMEAW